MSENYLNHLGFLNYMLFIIKNQLHNIKLQKYKNILLSLVITFVHNL